MESFQLEVSESNGTEFLLINQKILHKSIVALYEGRGYTDQCMSLVKTCLTELLAHICRNIKFYIHPAWGKFLKKWNQKQDMIQEAHQGTYIFKKWIQCAYKLFSVYIHCSILLDGEYTEAT